MGLRPGSVVNIVNENAAISGGPLAGGVMAAPAQVDSAGVTDQSGITSVPTGVLTLCCVCLFMVGFDWQALGYIAPAIVGDFRIPISALGSIFGAANVGFLIGAALVSMLADKIGRRPVLIAVTLWFAVIALLTARATSLPELLVLRFLSGIGFGSVVPIVTALVGEYSPREKRVTAVMVVTTLGMNGGAMTSGFVSAWLIPRLGWPSVFYVGGVVPLVLAVLMFFLLPESRQFLALPKAQQEGMPVRHLFREERTIATTLLWILNFMNLLIVHLVASWLPTVIREAGYSIASAALVATVFQIGGLIGTFILAWLIGRRGLVPVLTATLALTCGAVVVIGQPGLPLVFLTAAVFVTGWCVIGSQIGIIALAATFYPTSLRSSGVGWALGVGRAGAIVGPVIGGELIRLQWPTNQIFLAAAVPAAISTVAMLSLRGALKAR
jgi:MFS transporter, AAHS family, 4-hydroxybenzoate transporter